MPYARTVMRTIHCQLQVQKLNFITVTSGDAELLPFHVCVLDNFTAFSKNTDFYFSLSLCLLLDSHTNVPAFLAPNLQLIMQNGEI